MHLRILSVAALGLLAVAVQPAAAQIGGDKKKDDQAKKEPDITADTQVGGKNLDEWIKLIQDKEYSWELRDLPVKALGPVCWDKKESPPEVAVDALIAALKDLAFKVRLSALDALHRLRVAEIPATTENDSSRKYIKALN